MVVGRGLRAKGGAESKHIASRLSRFSVVFVGCIVISRSSLSDFGRRLLSLIVGCIVISLLSLSDFGRRLLSLASVSCIILSRSSLSDFGRRLCSLSDFGRRLLSLTLRCIVLSGSCLSDFGRRLHSAWCVVLVGSGVPSSISLRVFRGGSSGVPCVSVFSGGGGVWCAGLGGGGYFLSVLSRFTFCPFSLSLNLGFVGWVGRRSWVAISWEGLGAPFVFGDVSCFAFGVKTNLIFGAVPPPFRVLGFGVPIPVPGWSVVLGLVPLETSTNENRSGYVRCRAAVAVVARSMFSMLRSSVSSFLAPGSPYAEHVQETK